MIYLITWDMKLHKAQKEIIENENRFKVIRAGRRFGKTVLSIEEMVFTAVTTRNARVVYIAPTFQSARDIALEQLRKRISGVMGKFNEMRLEITLPNQFKGESNIFLRSWDNVETLRGQFFDLIILDEVAQYKNFWTNWYEVLRPTLTDKKGRAIFISTPSGFNHFYDLCNLELTDNDFKSFHFTSYDNPYLPVEELDKAKETLPHDRFIQEYMADFSKTSGLVYKEFMRNKHIYDVLPDKEFEKLGAVDFGYANPAAVLDIRYRDGSFFIENEWYKKQRTEAQIADYVAKCGFEVVFPDPESPSAIEELLQRGVNAREVIKGHDSVVSGIQKVRELLLAGKLKVNRRCVNTISEFEMYTYDDEESDRNTKEKPIKANDHALDALRYCVVMMANEDTGKIQQHRPPLGIV